MLTRLSRSLLVLVLVAVTGVALVAMPALAAEEEPAEEQAPVTFAPGDEPAIEVDLSAEPDEPGPQWTYRFLVPLTITLAVLVVLVTVIQYFVRVVRARYQVQ